MKKCRSCQKEIDQKASKCPYCLSKQGNWAQRHPIITGIIVIIIIFMGIGAFGSSKTTTNQSQGQSSSSSDEATENNVVNDSNPTSSPEEITNETVSQKNAVRKANSYISFTGFSRSGLIKQLEFDEFSAEDATYAVDKIAVDWNEQAAKKAKSYQDVSPFSRSGLIKQLEYEGFTAEQANHGADSVGL